MFSGFWSDAFILDKTGGLKKASAEGVSRKAPHILDCCYALRFVRVFQTRSKKTPTELRGAVCVTVCHGRPQKFFQRETAYTENVFRFAKVANEEAGETNLRNKRKISGLLRKTTCSYM